jgi:hypothetical protein
VLLTLKTLESIQRGEIDLAFRRWQKPTVKTGGRLRTAIGELAIGAVSIVDPASISDEDARRAGFDSADNLRADLFKERNAASSQARTARPTDASLIYRVEVSYVGEDSRIALRNAEMSDVELQELAGKIARIDERSTRGPWVERTLSLIETWPARRAPELAEIEGLETIPFKASVRKLKELGLTESLAVGYRLSPRGEKVLRVLQSD